MLTKRQEKGSECQFSRNMWGAGPVCVCAAQEANMHISSCWEPDERVARVTLLLRRGNGTLEENISDKIYRPEQCSGQVQRPAERMQLPPKAGASLCFPGDSLLKTYSSAWRTKAERNYKNDQNEAVPWSPKETKLPVSSNSDCPLGSGKQGAPQAFKLGP